MARLPLWIDTKTEGRVVTLSPSRCKNCGEIKVTSTPCGFDHLAALLEFNEYRESRA